MQKPVFSLSLLAALLLAGATQAQQTTKVKTKSAKRAATSTTAADQLPAPPAPGPGGPDALGGPAGPRPPHGPKGEHGPGGPGPRDERGPKGGAQVLSDVRGTITAYLAANDEQVYDAFVLRPEGGAAADTVRFPRHLGQQLTAAAKAGSTVTVTGVRDQGPDGRSHFRFVSLASGSQTVRDTPPTPPATPTTEQATTVGGTIRELRRDPKGRVRGLLLSDQTVVQLSPQAIEQLADKLKTGASLEASGTLRTPRPGEALATTTPPRVVRAETLTLDKVKYLVR